jgi:serine protease Do
VLEVNGKNIEQSADLANNVSDIRPGEIAKLAVWRGGKQQTIEVKVDELKDPDQRAAQSRASGPNSAVGGEAQEDARLGLVVRPLTGEEKRMVETAGSIVVENVKGSAARAGLQRGDIILAVNNQQVKTVDDLRTAAGKLNKGDAAALLVERGGAQIFVPIRVG